MKILSLNVILLFFCLNLAAQDATWDSTYRPGIYKSEVAKFKGHENSTSDIIFLGNSITAQADWASLLQNNNAKNRGISGDITFGILERLSEVTEGNPAKVFLLIGVNDISRNIPDSIIIGNIDKIVTRIQQESPKTKIYLETILPVNNTFTQFKNHYNKDEHIATVNVGINAIALRKGVVLINTHELFLDKDGRLREDLTKDGLHLKPEAYQLWAKALSPYLTD